MSEFFRSWSAIAVVLIAVLSGCDSVGPGPASAGDALLSDPVALRSPAGPGSGEPSLYTTADGRVHMSWIEPDGAGHALRFATLGADGWTSPRTIADSATFFVNWADFPSIIELADGALAAHWLQKRPGADSPYAYDVLISLSADGGEHWQPGLTPHRDGTAAEHGFVSMLPEIDGGLTAVWLDGRNAATAEPRPAGPGPDMTLRSAHVSGTGGITQEVLLDPRICDCCQTSATFVGETLLVAYRDRSAEEIRDIYTVRRDAQGWHEPVRVAQDDWMIPGCPVNGPAIAALEDAGAVAWFSLVGGAPEVKVAFTDDQGRSFGEPLLLERADGEWATLGRVDAEWIDAEIVLVTWLAAKGKRAEIRYRTASRGGELGPVRVLAETNPSRSSGFPRIARTGSELVFAWTVPGEPATIKMARLTLAAVPLPALR